MTSKQSSYPLSRYDIRTKELESFLNRSSFEAKQNLAKSSLEKQQALSLEKSSASTSRQLLSKQTPNQLSRSYFENNNSSTLLPIDPSNNRNISKGSRERIAQSSYENNKSAINSYEKGNLSSFRQNQDPNEQGYYQAPKRAVLNSIEKENAILRSELLEHQEEMEGIGKRVKDMFVENKKLRNALKEKKNDPIVQIQQQSDQLLKYSELNTELFEKMQKLQERLVAVEKEKDKYYKKCVFIAKKFKQLETQKNQQAEEFEEEIDSLKLTIDSIENDCKQRQNDADQWKARWENDSFLIQETNRRYDRALIKIQEMEDISAQDKVALQSEVREWEKKNEILKNEVETLKKERIELQFKDSSQKDSLAAMTAKHQLCKQKCEESLSRENDLLKRINSIQSELEKAQQFNQQLTKQLQQTIQTRDSIQQQLDTQQSIVSVNRMVDKFTTKKEDIDVATSKFKAELEEKQIQLEQTKHNFHTLFSQFVEAQNSIKEESTKRQLAEKELEDTKKHVVELTNQINLKIAQEQQQQSLLSDLSQQQMQVPIVIENQLPSFTDSQEQNDLNQQQDCISLQEKSKSSLGPLISQVKNKKKQIEMENSNLQKRLNQLEIQYPLASYSPNSTQFIPNKDTIKNKSNNTKNLSTISNKSIILNKQSSIYIPKGDDSSNLKYIEKYSAFQIDKSGSITLNNTQNNSKPLEYSMTQIPPLEEQQDQEIINQNVYMQQYKNHFLPFSKNQDQLQNYQQFQQQIQYQQQLPHFSQQQQYHFQQPNFQSQQQQYQMMQQQKPMNYQSSENEQEQSIGTQILNDKAKQFNGSLTFQFDNPMGIKNNLEQRQIINLRMDSEENQDACLTHIQNQQEQPINSNHIHSTSNPNINAFSSIQYPSDPSPNIQRQLIFN